MNRGKMENFFNEIKMYGLRVAMINVVITVCKRIIGAERLIILYDKERETGDISDGYHTFNELYEHRNVLFMAFCRELVNQKNPNVWRSRYHSDGSMYPGWFIMGINAIDGKQITYHLPDRLWERCDWCSELKNAPKFDGHTPKDVLSRIMSQYITD